MEHSIGATARAKLLIGGAVLLVLLALASCTSVAAPPQTTAFNGLELPSPKPVGGVNTQPPPAWLIVGDQAVPATYGSFCYKTGCVDMVQPQMMPDIATADLPADQQARIVVGSDAVSEFSANAQDWATDPAAETIAAEGEVEDNRTVFTLEPLPDTDDQLLQAFVTFREGGDATYLWRLNPAK